MKTLTTLLAVSGMVLALASAAQAGVITSPQDGYVGPYRLGFYTDNGFWDKPPHNSFSTNISWYNSEVTDSAGQVTELIALTGVTWRCIGSTETVDARDNTETNPTNPAHASVPIYNLNGQRIADDNAGLWAQTIPVPFTDQWGVAPNGEGTDVPSIEIKTGSQTGGIKEEGGRYLGSTIDPYPTVTKMDIDQAFIPERGWIWQGGGRAHGVWGRFLALSSVIEGGPIGTIVEVE